MLSPDLLFVLVLIFSVLVGAWRGVVAEVMSLVNWVAAFALAQWLAPDVARHLPTTEMPDMLRMAAGYVIVFVVAMVIGALLTRLLIGWIQSIGLRETDRGLGALFGLLRGFVILLAASVVLEMSPAKSTSWWRNSISSQASVSALRFIRPVLPEVMTRYLP